MPIGSHHSAAAGTDVWLTPPEVLAALGSFDLDPCAAVDQPWPTARQHYTIHDNGLAKPWQGRVWLNPPYANNVIGKWMRRMVDHGKGIALIFARTETAVFHSTVWREADALLFQEGRLHFHRPEAPDVERCRTHPHEWVVYDLKTEAQACVHCGKAKANAGAPSVFCAYGAEDADRLASSGIPGTFVPLRMRSLIFGFSEVGSWVEEVVKVMENAGDAMHVQDLYRALADSPKAQRNPNWKAKIRQTVQRGPFEAKGGGVWKVAEGRLL